MKRFLVLLLVTLLVVVVVVPVSAHEGHTEDDEAPSQTLDLGALCQVVVQSEGDFPEELPATVFNLLSFSIPSPNIREILPGDWDHDLFHSAYNEAHGIITQGKCHKHDQTYICGWWCSKNAPWPPYPCIGSWIPSYCLHKAHCDIPLYGVDDER